MKKLLTIALVSVSFSLFAQQNNTDGWEVKPNQDVVKKKINPVM